MKKQQRYTLETDGSFVIRDYNHAAPFSGFLPGIAGLWGKPLWTFYVNRGQAMCAAGVRDKNGAMIEFKSSNVAYSDVFTKGFRTFLKIRKGSLAWNHEPFRTHTIERDRFDQTMKVLPYEVSVNEHDRKTGLGIESTYFTLPNEKIPGLVRVVTITNSSKQTIDIELLDGVSSLIPFGTSDEMLKNMHNLAQTYALVSGVSSRIPHFKIKLSGDDDTVVGKVTSAHFIFGYNLDTPDGLLKVIVDPDVVFGSSTDLEQPEAFLRNQSFCVPKRQNTENVLPTGFVFARLSLPAGEQRRFAVFLGNSSKPKEISSLSRRMRSDGYLDKKRSENRQETERVSQYAAMVSGDDRLDAYTRQNFLDNALRGGLPITLRSGKNPLTLHLYSRKHGDLERDYNFFVVEPTSFSQGEGNNRDVSQNRRMELFFNPDIGESTLRYFLNLVQADGFAPNLIEPDRFRCARTRALKALLVRMSGGRHSEELAEYVTQDFEIGLLFQFIERRGIRLAVKQDAFLKEILYYAESQPAQDLGSGFHTDPWFYNLDLLESYRGIYPERLRHLLFCDNGFYYGDSYAFVKPRSRRYAMVAGRPMQPCSIEQDKAKMVMMNARSFLSYAMRTKHGKGKVYYTTLVPKLVALAAIKVASLDSFGAGVEMESDRSNWYDALSGLPGLFGSSTHETFALKRLLIFLRSELRNIPDDFEWVFPKEIAEFMGGLLALLENPPKRRAPGERLFAFWDAASNLKEDLRAAVRFGFEGNAQRFDHEKILCFVRLSLKKVEAGLSRSRDAKTGLYHGYYRFDLVDYKTRRDGTIVPRAFRRHALPLFLEAQVHAVRSAGSTRKAADLAKAVKASALYDRKLKMYKCNACLDSEPMDIGRTRSFARGWLENESIWLHMEYKYLLELLRAGLHKEFYTAFRHAGIPFLDPAMYGRSPTENVSFLVSSAYPDPGLVGRGYQARLTGATSEFVNIWILMCVGDRPFYLNRRGELEAEFKPVLPDWLFTKKRKMLKLLDADGQDRSHAVPAKSFAFVFLGHTVMTYRQKGKVRDTFGLRGALIRSIELTYDNGQVFSLKGAAISEPHSSALRERRIAAMTCVMEYDRGGMNQ